MPRLSDADGSAPRTPWCCTSDLNSRARPGLALRHPALPVLSLSKCLSRALSSRACRRAQQMPRPPVPVPGSGTLWMRRNGITSCNRIFRGVCVPVPASSLIPYSLLLTFPLLYLHEIPISCRRCSVNHERKDCTCNSTRYSWFFVQNFC